MENADLSVGPQTDRQSALSKELIAILAVGVVLLVAQISTYTMLRADIADLRDDVVSVWEEFRRAY